MIEVLDNLEPHIGISEVRRLLGAKHPGAKSTKETEELIAEAMELSARLVAPKGVYGFFKNQDFAGSGFLGGEDEAALAICTIGDALETTVRDLSSSGKLALAVTLDATGSVAAEAVADEINRHVCDEANRRGLRPMPRFSPGYGPWKLSEQTILFGLLPANQIGVGLNESFMMVPRKSISFAVRFSEADDETHTGTQCENCGLKNCPMRMIPD